MRIRLLWPTFRRRRSIVTCGCNVTGRKRASVADLELPGDFCFWHIADDGQSGFMAFKCPCGQDVHQRGHDSISVRTAAAGGQGDGFWTWDGNQDAPTLAPSIQRTEGCMWHGWLQNGEWHT